MDKEEEKIKFHVALIRKSYSARIKDTTSAYCFEDFSTRKAYVRTQFYSAWHIMTVHYLAKLTLFLFTLSLYSIS